MKHFVKAAALAVLVSAPAAAIAQEGPNYAVYFPFASAALNDDARTTITQAAETFRSTGSAEVTLEGHTDTVGSQDYNVDLSRRRAEAVQQALIAQGVSPDAITIEALGQNDLAVQTGDGVRNQQNRRVTINLMRPQPMAEPAPMMEPEEEGPTLFGFDISVGPYFGWGLSTSDTNDDSAYMPGVNFVARYEATPNITIEGEQAVFWTFADDDAGDSDNGIGGRSVIGANYQLDLAGGLFPYIGANVGGIYTDSAFGKTWIYGPEIGFQWRWLEAKVAYDIPFERDFGNGVVSATLGGVFRF